jgi:putative Mg2+ transporter-C (MgtC) family protein
VSMSMFLPHDLYGSYELGVLLKILLAAMSGALIGLEREKHGRPAGLRTHLLVAAGACLMVIVSEGFYLKYHHLNGVESSLRVDPARVAAQIVSGIGFLGAGVIIKEGLSVRGLTTAASLWLVAGLGMAFGVGLLGPGLIATAVALFCLITLKRLEPLLKKDRYVHLKVIARLEPDIYPELTEIFTLRKLRITDLSSTLDLENGTVTYQFNVVQHRKVIGRELTTLIAALPGVKRISFQ